MIEVLQNLLHGKTNYPQPHLARVRDRPMGRWVMSDVDDRFISQMQSTEHNAFRHEKPKRDMKGSMVSTIV